jgi:hypothetical protein
MNGNFNSANPGAQAGTSQLAPNLADISAHLHALFAPDFVHHYPDAWIEIAYCRPDEKLNKAEIFSAFDLEGAAKFAFDTNTRGFNVYVGAALRHGDKPKSGRASDTHFLAARYCWAEYDNAGDHERITAICQELGPQPALGVATGTIPNPRLQIFLKMAQPTTEADEIKACNKALKELFQSDDVENPSRVMRLAGTVNYPKKDKRAKGYETALTTLHINRNAPSYSVEALCGLSPASESADAADADYDAFDEFGRANGSRGMEKVRELLASVRPGHWHIPMRDAVAVMIGLGWSSDQIKLGCAPYCRRGFDDPELQKLIDTGRDKWNKPDPDGTGTTQKGPVDPVDLWGKFDPPSFPSGLLPEIIERFAFDQGADMGADMSGIAMSALAVCAAAIPDGVRLQVKRHNIGWLEPARLWVALVGSPSSKKSPIMAAAAHPLRKIDADQAREYAEKRAAHDKLPKEEKLKVDPPQQVRSVLQDTTIEAAQDVLKDSPDGLLCYQDELSGWFGGMDKYSAGRGSAKDRAFWLEAFNGGSYSVQRVGRGSVFIENLSISLIGGIQPEPIRQIADESVDDGLLQRLLPITVRPAVAGRDEAVSLVVEQYASQIGILKGLADTLLRFDDGAQGYRQELEAKHLKLQTLECVHRKLAAHIGKYDGIFARLCVIWHCVENAKLLGELPSTIDEQTARRVGAFLHGFLLPHAIAFYAGVLGLSNDHDNVTAVAGHILSHGLTKITNRDLKRGDRAMRKLGSDEALAVFEQLEAFGWLDRAPSPHRGAPPHWLVNPAVHQKFAERAKSEAARRAQVRQMIADAVGGGVEP